MGRSSVDGFLHDPAVAAALVSGMVGWVAPYVAARIRLRSKERLAEIETEQSGQMRFYADLQAELVRTRTENASMDRRVLLLERAVLQRDGRLSAIEMDLARLKNLLEEEKPQISALLSMVTRMLEAVRRREALSIEGTG